MTIALVNSTTTTSLAAGTMSVTLPTHSEGDYLVLAFVHDYNSDPQLLTSVDSGFTELAESSVAGLNHQAAIWVKKAGASETNPTATFGASSQEMACLAFAFSGVDATTQIDIGPSTWVTEDPGDGGVDSPSVTTVTNNAVLVSVGTADENDAFTQPVGMTLIDSFDYNNMTVAAAYETIATAGATGARSWTFAQTTDEITAVSFAIRPSLVSAFSITPSTTTPTEGETVTITIGQGTGPYTATLNGDALTIDSQNATTATITWPDLKAFGTKNQSYETAYSLVITDTNDSDTDSVDMTTQILVGHAHATITATTGIYADDVGIAIGDRAYGYWVAGTGSEDLTVGAIQSDAGGTFRYWIQDDTDSVWGSYADEVIATTPSTPSAPPSKFSVNSLAAYLRETGNYTNTQTNAIVFEWLLSEGVRRTQLNQMLYEFLGGLGHTGSLDDRLAKWDGPASGFPYTFPFTFKSPPPLS